MLIRGREKPWSAVNPPLLQLCATWLKCRNDTLKSDFLFTQKDFLSSNHLSVISQNLFFETGDLRPQGESAATSPQSVTDPNSMTSFLSSELIFSLPQFFPSS